MNENIPTPRTDGQEGRTFYSFSTHYEQMTILARDLERELTLARAERDEAKRSLNTSSAEEEDRLRAENAALKLTQEGLARKLLEYLEHPSIDGKQPDRRNDRSELHSLALKALFTLNAKKTK